MKSWNEKPSERNGKRDEEKGKPQVEQKMGTWNNAKNAYIEHCFSSRSISGGSRREIETQNNKRQKE